MFTNPIPARISPEQKEKIRRIAFEKRVSSSEIVRIAITEYLERESNEAA